jgi:rRNA maturation endonuclease Nob1
MEYDNEVWSCSGCGLEWVFTDVPPNEDPDFKFCPKCGGRIGKFKMPMKEAT